ncbi:hypothetical protein J2J97_31840 (plasmid) [Rhizobium bangladeshense]|uniref:hypothetical protein n=1 Tax=Rhizobium bangladeshense TaxID=1138189 RepID=UPI001A9861F8|nr:hypothetical protein [Rhizobium bangladeshense]QSY98664.1 hypothetical protein J2J97_31840 [Rhizobium bangladeshense]
MLSDIRQTLSRDTIWMELANAALLLVWTVVLLAPPPTFGTSPSYRMMAAWASEPVWACFALLVASFALWGLGRLSWQRSIGLQGGVFFWGTIGSTMIFSNVGEIGGWVYIVVSNLCALAYVFGRR